MSNLPDASHAERRVASMPENNLNIDDALLLQMSEDANGTLRAWEAMIGDVYLPGKFDTAHLRDIHAHVMQDILPKPGATRGDELLIARHYGKPRLPEYDTRIGAEGQYITLLGADKVNDRLEELSRCLAREGTLGGMDKALFLSRLAEYYVRYSYAAPFQSGTALVLDVVLHLIGVEAGYRVEPYTVKQLREATDAILEAGVASDKTRLIHVLSSIVIKEEGSEAQARRHPTQWQMAQTLPA